MSKPKKARKTQKRRGKFFYLALALVIFGEAAFVAMMFLPGVLSRITTPTVASQGISTANITQGMLSLLYNPSTNSLINASAMGFINNEKPMVMFLTVNDISVIETTCSVWPVLYNASAYHGYTVIVVVLPNPPSQAPASTGSIQLFNSYVSQLCGFSPSSTNFMIVTTFWDNITEGTYVIPGYQTLLTQLLTKLGMNVSNVYLPILILIGPHNAVNATGIIYGQQLANATYLNEALFPSNSN
ncbi:hypothetical protein [Vulcanisaeta souniana]|uniref:Uncharacterized protein n=1 Tax=Vulcanisaeta souniana JCM 11219 TaxID=1293586 RepID=A0A830E154_9CREN|nr:hypothetical protein [Vulcanisaeta souniana]BDR91337.1 hypothetical protein Vsou_04300 [Vulcanisaeta souniana JCM 11219]GGI72443.1 hypothetical protein GCM10007112_06520 [Vulcanisaeta souniana JCM 11219]